MSGKMRTLSLVTLLVAGLPLTAQAVVVPAPPKPALKPPVVQAKPAVTPPQSKQKPKPPVKTVAPKPPITSKRAAPKVVAPTPANGATGKSAGASRPAQPAPAGGNTPGAQ